MGDPGGNYNAMCEVLQMEMHKERGSPTSNSAWDSGKSFTEEVTSELEFER